MSDNILTDFGDVFIGYEDTSKMTSGWICPKCGRVFAPSCQQCLFCNEAGSSMPLHLQQIENVRKEE